jgi:hypothetical protein
MICKSIEKQRVKRVFEKLVSPEQVENLLRDRPDLTQHQRRRIEFIVTFVRGEIPEDVSKRICQVTDIATTHGAMFHEIIGALVIVAFGTDPTSAPKPENRLLLVQSLQQELARDVKIVHGAAAGHTAFLEARIDLAILSSCHNLTRFSGK